MGVDWSRNVLWMSPAARAAVADAHLVVVGCGGNGVAFCVDAAHLGFRRFTLCDGDSLDESNLNRFIVALPGEVGRPKVEVIRSYLTARFPGADVDAIAEPFPNARLDDRLGPGSLVVGCLDDAFARIELDVHARRHGRTLVDLGSGFVVDASAGSGDPVLGAGGQVAISRPGGPCLRCLGFDLDGTKHTYYAPEATPEPSSLLLNSIVAALAAEAVVRELCGALAPVNFIAYDRERCHLARGEVAARPGCAICGPDGARHVDAVGGVAALRAGLIAEGVRCRTS